MGLPQEETPASGKPWFANGLLGKLIGDLFLGRINFFREKISAASPRGGWWWGEKGVEFW